MTVRRTIENMVPDAQPSPARRIAIAVGAAGAALALRLALDPFLGDLVPWVMFFPAVLVASLVGGTSGGLLALALCALAGHLAFVPPRWSFQFAGAAHVVSLASFLLVGGALVALGSALRRNVWDLRRRTTEAVAAHAALGEHEARLRDALGRIQAVTDLMAASVTHISKDRRYLWASRRYAEWLGVPLESLIGRPVVEFIGEQAYRQLEPQFRRVLAGERVEYEEQVEVRGIGRRWVNGVYVPTRDAAGEVDGWVAVVIDITKRKRIEASLQESEQWRWLALDAAQLGAWDYWCDTGVVVRDERSRRQVGASEGTSTAEAEGERIHPDDRPLVKNAFACAIAGDGGLDVEFRVVLPDGSVRWIASHGRAFFEGEGEARRAVRLAGANMDITDRKRIENEAVTLYARAEQARREAEQALGALREADQRKDEFLAMLAHELRNPLAPIRNAVEVMRLVGGPSPREQRAREIVDRQLTHLTRLVDDLLEVSRITRGKIALTRTVLRLSDVVDEAIETARPLVEQHEHTLSVVHAPDAIRLEGDRARLVQVIANLLTNAAKFTPRGGHIALTTTRSDGGAAVVKVRDTGIGIPVEMQARVFELFAQEESTLARSQGGLGIGLTLVKRLVELHGGSVMLESEGRGRGAQFTVTLPALAAAPRDADGDAPPAAHPRGDTLRIVIVEDNPDAAESFQMLLALGGHEIRVAHHGIQALRLLEEFTPDVAFIDIGLPGMTGFELAQRLRADQRTKNALLVAVTGYGREADREQAAGAGFDRHLTKPVDPDVVLAILSSLGSSLASSDRAATLH